MIVPRPIAAILAGCLALHGLFGCQSGPGKPVVWLRGDAQTRGARKDDPTAPVTEAYKSVEEYPLQTAPGVGEDSTVTEAGGDVEKSAADPMVATSRGLFNRRNRPVKHGVADARSAAERGSVSEPVETQHRLVPQPERKPGFWERIGNGFRNISDLARGQRPVNALAVLPFHPQAKKSVKDATAGETKRSIRIPAFSFQATESISQTTAFDAPPESPSSDLVSHWSDYPTASEATGDDESRIESSGPLLQAPQATASP